MLSTVIIILFWVLVSMIAKHCNEERVSPAFAMFIGYILGLLHILILAFIK